MTLQHTVHLVACSGRILSNVFLLASVFAQIIQLLRITLARIRRRLVTNSRILAVLGATSVRLKTQPYVLPLCADGSTILIQLRKNDSFLLFLSNNLVDQ